MESEGIVDVTDGVFTYKKIIHKPRVVLTSEASIRQLNHLKKLAEKAETSCMISKAIQGNVELELQEEISIAD